VIGPAAALLDDRNVCTQNLDAIAWPRNDRLLGLVRQPAVAGGRFVALGEKSHRGK
jgi:hypothetical protein